MDTSKDKKSILKDILGKTENVYTKVQKGINAAADKFRRPFDPVKDMPGKRRPIMPDPRTKRPMPFPKVPPAVRPIMRPRPKQPIVNTNKTLPVMPNLTKVLNPVTKPGIISKPVIGSIKRPV